MINILTRDANGLGYSGMFITAKENRTKDGETAKHTAIELRDVDPVSNPKKGRKTKAFDTEGIRILPVATELYSGTGNAACERKKRAE